MWRLGFEANLPAPLCYKTVPTCMAPPNRFLEWIHTLIALHAWKMLNVSGQCAFLYLTCILPIFHSRHIVVHVHMCYLNTSRGYSIWEWHYFIQHVRRCGDNSRVVTNQEQHLIKQIWYLKCKMVLLDKQTCLLLTNKKVKAVNQHVKFVAYNMNPMHSQDTNNQGQIQQLYTWTKRGDWEICDWDWSHNSC